MIANTLSNPSLPLSCDELDELHRPAPESVDFDNVVDSAMSRRDFFKGSALLFGSGLFFKSSLTQAVLKTEARPFDVYQFENVPANTNDTTTLPKDYQWKPLVSWGDPLWSTSQDFKTTAAVSAESQALSFGDNNDGMKHFKVAGRELLAINNEYVNFSSFFQHRQSVKPETKEGALKTQQAVGVSIVEVVSTPNGWRVVTDSPYNRRITAQTPMHITGPARGHALMQTKADPNGLSLWEHGQIVAVAKPRGEPI